MHHPPRARDDVLLVRVEERRTAGRTRARRPAAPRRPRGSPRARRAARPSAPARRAAARPCSDLGRRCHRRARRRRRRATITASTPARSSSTTSRRASSPAGRRSRACRRARRAAGRARARAGSSSSAPASRKISGSNFSSASSSCSSSSTRTASSSVACAFSSSRRELTMQASAPSTRACAPIRGRAPGPRRRSRIASSSSGAVSVHERAPRRPASSRLPSRESAPFTSATIEMPSPSEIAWLKRRPVIRRNCGAIASHTRAHFLDRLSAGRRPGAP